MYESAAFLIPHSSFSILASWVPFVTPAPLWHVWWVLVFPLVAAVAIVYKCVKCRYAHEIPLQAARLFGVILLAMALGGAALTGLVKLVLG